MAFTADEWAAGIGFEEYLGKVEQHRELWLSHWESAQVDEISRARLADLPGDRRVLILTEDWCGDAVRSVPTIVKACEASPRIEVRVIDVSGHPDLMNRHLTKGAKAIPVAMVSDPAGNDYGWWGPRPAALQTLLRRQLIEQGRPQKDDYGRFYAPLMTWYRKDEGKTILDEFLLLLERGAPTA